MATANVDVIKSMMDGGISGIKVFVEAMFNDLKSEIRELRSENFELKKSLEFSQAEIDNLKAEVSQLQNVSSSQELNNIPDRMRMLEDDSKKLNIRVTGLTEDPTETFEQTQFKVNQLISGKLGIPDLSVKSAFRAGKRGVRTDGPRPIVATLSSVEEKFKCFKSSPRLKGSDIFISDDVSKATAEIRKQKLETLKQKRREGYIAYFSGTEIVCKVRRNALDGTGMPKQTGDQSQDPSHTPNARNDQTIPPRKSARQNEPGASQGNTASGSSASGGTNVSKKPAKGTAKKT